jgi:hypothetical protein
MGIPARCMAFLLMSYQTVKHDQLVKKPYGLETARWQGN